MEKENLKGTDLNKLGNELFKNALKLLSRGLPTSDIEAICVNSTIALVNKDQFTLDRATCDTMYRAISRAFEKFHPISGPPTGKGELNLETLDVSTRQLIKQGFFEAALRIALKAAEHNFILNEETLIRIISGTKDTPYLQEQRKKLEQIRINEYQDAKD